MKGWAVVLLLTPTLAGGYQDGPPPAHTGGFGEPDCRACHQGGPGARDGVLVWRGIPDGYRPGEPYQVTVTLSSPGMALAGVQLSARTDPGRQAGVWSSLPSDLTLRPAGKPPVDYVQHQAARVLSDGRARWRLTWRAPQDCAGIIRFHAAANAANQDDSAFGDRGFTAVATSPPAIDCEVAPAM